MYSFSTTMNHGRSRSHELISHDFSTMGLPKHETTAATYNQPAQTIQFENVPSRLEVVVNQLSQDILMLVFKRSIGFFYLRKKNEPSANENAVECVKIHELFVNPEEHIEAAGVSHVISLHSANQKLRYAYSIYGSYQLYIVDFNGAIPDKNTARSTYITSSSPTNQAACSDIKFDQDQGRFIACLTDAPCCNVWDSKKQQLIVTVPLTEIGVCVSWHKSEEFKVMIACRDGTIIFYNVVKQQAIQSISLGASPIRFVDGSPSNSCFIAYCTHSGVHFMDVSKPYTAHLTIAENLPCKRVRFAPLDHNLLAALNSTDLSVKLFRMQLQAMVWSNSWKEVQDVNFTTGASLLLVAAGKSLYIYDL